MLKNILITFTLNSNSFYKNFINDYILHWSIKSYSQEGEDMILKRIFEDQEYGFTLILVRIILKDFQTLIFINEVGMG